MRPAPLFALVFFACTPDPPPPPTARPIAPVAASSLPATSVVTPAPTPTPQASLSPLPSRITICELEANQHGSWQPTLDEVLAAAAVFPSQCLTPKDRAPAIRACAARLGKPTVKVGVGSIDQEGTCDESFSPATWNGRRWIVMDVGSFSVARAASSGSVFSAELRGATAVPYVDNEGIGPNCRSSPGAPKASRADWAKLPADLALFLCGSKP